VCPTAESLSLKVYGESQAWELAARLIYLPAWEVESKNNQCREKEKVNKGATGRLMTISEKKSAGQKAGIKCDGGRRSYQAKGGKNKTRDRIRLEEDGSQALRVHCAVITAHQVSTFRIQF
jgi:hypothetical protein